MKLFGSGALEVMREIADPWLGLVFLRSAPGGGKTTLLRLLTPRPLELTRRLVDNPQVKLTHDNLIERGAVSANQPEIFATMVEFTTEYRELSEYDRGNSLFRELLNSRIVISTLRALLARSERVYPHDLDTINVEWEPESEATIPAKADGIELFKWASTIENRFYERMDDLGDSDPVSGGHARLDALKWFAKATMVDIQGPVTAKRVLLLDEVQRLSRDQRGSLTKLLIDARENCGIWVSERLEALHHRELLSEGALEQRDYEGVVQLEQKWKGRRKKTYAKFVEQIANLRAAKAEGFEGRDFFSGIAETDDVACWGKKFDAACEVIRARIEDQIRGEARYDDWLRKAERVVGSAWKKALYWRVTEVLIAREMSRTQAEFSFVLTEDQFEQRAHDHGIERAAEHFLRSELQAPVYFGRHAIAGVSSSNVDQYLEVTGELFSELAAKYSGPRDQPGALSTDRQDAIIRQVARQRWDGLIRRLPQGAAAMRLLQGFEAYSRQQTFRPTAPYAPGVTGFAITMAEREELIDRPDERIGHLIKLRDVLTSLVAHNLLIPNLDRQQGGRAVVVFYLNRLLCVQFGLPLGFGGWRHKSLLELNEWLERGPARALDIAGRKLV